MRQHKNFIAAMTLGQGSKMERGYVTLDLHGVRAIEIREKVIRFLDAAVAGAVGNCRIVYGVGTGTARSIVLETLEELKKQNSPYLTDYIFSETECVVYNEGKIF